METTKTRKRVRKDSSDKDVKSNPSEKVGHATQEPVTQESSTQDHVMEGVVVQGGEISGGLEKKEKAAENDPQEVAAQKAAFAAVKEVPPKSKPLVFSDLFSWDEIEYRPSWGSKAPGLMVFSVCSLKKDVGSLKTGTTFESIIFYLDAGKILFMKDSSMQNEKELIFSLDIYQ